MSADQLLKRQLKKLGLTDQEVLPTPEQWASFLKTVKETYIENESQRTLNENMTDKAMAEMDRLNRMIQDQAQESVQRTEEKLVQVMEAVPSLVIWTDSSSKIVGANQNFGAIFNRSVSSLVGLRFQDLGWASIDQQVESLFRVRREEENIDLILQVDNSTKYYKFLFKKFANNQMMVIVGVDFTADILKKKELEDTQASLLASSRMALLGEMAAGIAHEINNPLAIIHALSFQIRKRIEDRQIDDVPERLQKIDKTIMRITKIISGLRTFARDGTHDPFDLVPLKKVIDDSLELASERLRNSNIELRIDEVPESLIVECRASQISQVILNLVGNARDAIQGLEKKWLHIGFADRNEIVEITITDSGSGIPLEVQEKIFRPFFTTKEVGVGTGLGLSISMGIVQSHQGSMRIDNNCSNTRFVISLPKIQNSKIKYELKEG